MQKYTVEIDNNKTIRWYIFNTKMLHRAYGPAIEYTNGDKHWFQNDQCHRLDGPAVEYNDGHKEWCQNGKFHREDGPAREYANGNKFWYQNGQYHRLDGPAVEYANGHKEWYIEGVKYTEEQFLKHTTKQVSCDGKVFTDENGYKYKLVEI